MREEFRHHIPISKVKCGLTFIFFILVGVVCPLIIFYEFRRGANMDSRASLLMVLSPVTIPFFIYVAILYARKFFDPRSGLLFTDEGLFDNSGLFKDNYVKWDEVSAIHLTSINTGYTKASHRIEVRTERPEGFSTLTKLSRWNSMLCNDKAEAARTKIVITSHAVGTSYDKIVEAFRTHQPRPVIDERKYW
jgi:hypothetical protein